MSKITGLSIVEVTVRYFVIAALLCGCTHRVDLKPTVDQLPSVVKIPIEIGVYYSPAFQADEYTIIIVKMFGPSTDIRVVYPLGPASIALFDQALPAMFSKTTRVQGLPPLAPDGPKVVAVIEPTIERFDTMVMREPTVKKTEISYRFNIYSPGGELITSWTVEGRGRAAVKIFSHVSKNESANLAMQDAAAKVMTEFIDFPGIRRWLAGMGIVVSQ
ncbi:MAG: hypothetical protein ACLPX5_12955 [Dissulfurispiraceae bacterium]